MVIQNVVEQNFEVEAMEKMAIIKVQNVVVINKIKKNDKKDITKLDMDVLY